MLFSHLDGVFVGKKMSLAENDSVNERKNNTINYVKSVLGWEVVNYHERIQEWIVNTWLNISSKDILWLLWLTIDDFENKTSLDIWWWFSDLPFLLESIKTNTIIVDPIFNYMIKTHIQKNINTFKEFDAYIIKSIFKNQEKIDELNIYTDLINLTDTNSRIRLGAINTKISSLESKNKNLNSLLQTHNELTITLKKWLDLKDIDLEVMSSDKWLQIWSNIVNINWSLWDNIEWIENNSVDLIFINHVITKSTVNPIKLLKQADKLLKQGWKIYIMENDIIYSDNLNIFSDYDFEVKYENERDKTIFILTKKI